MAYSTNPNLPKARALALQLLVRDGLPVQVVANKRGIHLSLKMSPAAYAAQLKRRGRMFAGKAA